MNKNVELLIVEKKALMNECFSKSNAYNADGIRLSIEINEIVELSNQNDDLRKENNSLDNKLKKYTEKKK